MSTYNFLVNPSLIMSNLCYSIFKLEPFSICPNACIYCYVNMLPWRIRRNFNISIYLNQYKKVVHNFKNIFRLSPAFRMSTLADPFISKEKEKMFSYRIMKTSYEIKSPLIINTKGTLIVEDPWIEILKKLGKENLIVYQASIALTDEDAKILEPNAPLPSNRLEVIKEVSRLGIPTIARLQPLIPSINTDIEYLENLISEFKEAGVKQVISESFRFSSKKLLLRFKPLIRKKKISFYEILNSKLWELIPKSSQKRPMLSFRRELMKTIQEISISKKLDFSTCREGFYSLHTVPNCCGLHYLGKYLVRPTLVEVLGIDMLFKPLRDKNKEVMGRDKIKSLKFGIGRTLLNHLDLINETIRDISLLKNIAPDIVIES